MLCTSVGLFAQGTFIPLGSDAYHYIDRLDIKYSKIIPISHTSQKTYQRGMAGRLAETMLLSNLRFNKVERGRIKYLIDDNADWLDSVNSISSKPWWKMYREPATFLHVSSNNKGLFDIRANAIGELRLGGETYKNRFLFNRTAGVELRGNIKRVFSYYFNLTQTAARIPQYATDRAQYEKIKDSVGLEDYTYVPNEAYWKDYSSKIFKFQDGLDYFDARGYITAHILKHINITFGRDQHFIGNGVRSHILSDFAPAYLFLKFNVKVWRVSYQSIFAELTSQYKRGADQLLPKKYMALHHLSIQATHWLNVGFFESVIMSRSNHFELQYLNPLIFYRSVEHALGSPDNVLLGGDYKVNIMNHASIYGQFVLDEFSFKNVAKRTRWWANKYAMQVGVKYIDIVPNLDAQAEFNLVRPFTYTSGDTRINYTHYNQPLAHPLGAGFYEFLFNVRYQPHARVTMNLRAMFAKTTGDSLWVNPKNNRRELTNFGGDIFRNAAPLTVTNEFGNRIGQGAGGSLAYIQFLTSYMPWHNFFVDFELLYRSNNSVSSTNNRNPVRSSLVYSVGARLNFAYKNHEF